MKTRRKMLALSKRILAIMLAVLLTVGLLPTSLVHAQTPDSDDEAVLELQPEKVVNEEGEETGEEAEEDLESWPEVQEADNPASEEPGTLVTLFGVKSALLDQILSLNSDEENEQDDYRFEYDTSTIVAPYQEKKPSTHYNDVLLPLVKNNIRIAVDYVEKTNELKDYIEYKWQKLGTDGKTWSDMEPEDTPCKTGQYRLVAFIDARNNICSAKEEVIFNFRIRKAVLNLNSDRTYVRAGITAEEISKIYSKTTCKVDVSYSTVDFALYGTVDNAEVYDANSKKLAGSDKLLYGKEYYLKYVVTLKDPENYEIGLNCRNILFSDLISTKIEIKYNENSEGLSKVYDGKPVDMDKFQQSFDAKVYYSTGVVDEYELLEGAEIFGKWLDANRVPCDDPTEAGVYWYRLYYDGEEGIYAPTGYERLYSEVRFEILMAEVAVKPELKTDAAQGTETAKFYAGQKVRDVLKQVSYQVFDVTAGPNNGDKYILADEPREVDEYFFGTGYNVMNNGKEQPYKPTFTVQKAILSIPDPAKPENVTVTGWTNLGQNETLTYEEEIAVNVGGTEENRTVKSQYRVVFSGKKGIYDNGVIPSDNNCIDVNASQKNYKVNCTSKMIEESLVTFEVVGAEKVKIDVTAILAKDEKKSGKEFSQPQEFPYSGKSIYQSKEDYKKAVVKAVNEKGEEGAEMKAASDSLKYTWVKTKASEWYQEDGVWKFPRNEEAWADAWENAWETENAVNYANVEEHCSPYNVDTYALHVELIDPEFKYAYADAYVYYVIKPVDAAAELTGDELTIFADGINTVEDLLRDFQNAKTKLEFYPVTVTEKDENTVEVTKEEGAKPLDYVDFDHNDFEQIKKYFCVEKTGIDGSWIRCDDLDELLVYDENTKYRINVRNENATDLTIKNGNSEEKLGKNYNLGNKLDSHNQVVVSNYYENKTLDVTVKKTKGIELEFVLDESLITNKIKFYDGKSIDIDSVKKNIKIQTKEEGEDVTDKVKDRLVYKFIGLEYFNTPSEEAIHADNYILEVSMPTDEDYIQWSQTLDNTVFTILKKQIVIKPVLGTIKAGKAPNLVAAETPWYIENEDEIPENDKAFKDIFFNYVTFIIRDDKGNEPTFLSSLRTYYVRMEGYWFNTIPDIPLYIARDYDVVSGVVSFKPESVACEVTGNDGCVLNDDAVKDASGTFVHTITTKNGIPYDTSLDGNYVSFKIKQPQETTYGDNDFIRGIIYKDSIEAAGGSYYVSRWGDGSTVEVRFNVDQKESKPSFVILWEDGYSEKFIVDLAQMRNYKLADLTQAVSPKSISFIKPITKMAAGDTQQLDVKVTKSQLGDVILLAYESSDDSVVVSETGLVTAVKPNKKGAVITAYPCKKVGYNDELVRLEGKGIKTAKVKITVTEVAAPNIKKVAAKDTSAEVIYTKPQNGYRREIYVLEGKNKKVSDFEDKISETVNGDYDSNFVYTQLSCNEISEKDNTVRIPNRLKPGQDYTVYVRNVSQLRVMANEEEVAPSHAGKVKSFKTTLSQVIELDAEIAGATSEGTDLDGTDVYSVPLKNKSVKVSSKGKFLQNKSYSDETDYIWRDLPLKGDLKKQYLAPKISYYITDEAYVLSSDSADRKWGNSKNWVQVGNRFYKKTAKIAAINNSGKITLKGMGTVSVIIIDNNSSRYKVVTLNITAQPDSFSAKKIKLAVGQTVKLSDYLEYKEGKIKIVGYAQYNPYLYTDTQSNDDFSIRQIGGNKYGGDLEIKALKPGKKLELEVKDRNVEWNGGKPIMVTITSSPIQTVKTVKKDIVFDDGFNFTFKYPASSATFRFVLKDSKGKVITDEQRTYDGDRDNKSKKESYIYSYGYADEALRNYITWDRYGVAKLTRLSNYTVEISVMEGTEVSKAVKLKVKTTDIPLSYENLQSDAHNDGEAISVLSNGVEGSVVMGLGENVSLRSGNSYTLQATVDNDMAISRASDSYIWKVKDSSVAKIQAKTNRTAILTTLKLGSTEIELTSKITKKVVARRTLNVAAVGSGEDNSYFGENEPYKPQDEAYWAEFELEALEVFLDTPVIVSVPSGMKQNFVFIAPAGGKYRVSGDVSTQYRNEYGYMERYEGDAIEKGTKLYIEASNVYNQGAKTVTITVSAAEFRNTIQIDGDKRVKGEDTVFFTAPEDNVYHFYRVDKNGTREELKKFFEYDENGVRKEVRGGNYIGLFKDDLLEIVVEGVPGEEYTIEVEKREIKGSLNDVGEDGKVHITASKSDSKGCWYSFTADETNLYQFFFSDLKGGEMRVERFMRLDQEYIKGEDVWQVGDTYNIYETNQFRIEKDRTIYFRFTPLTDQGDTVSLSVSVSKMKFSGTLTTAEEGNKISVKTEKEWYYFTAPSDGYYTFSTEGVGDATVRVRYLESIEFAMNGWAFNGENPEPGDFRKVVRYEAGDRKMFSFVSDKEKDITVFIKLRSVDGTVALDKPATVELKPGEEKWYTFDSEENGIYQFFTNGEKNVNLYVGIQNDLMSGEENPRNYEVTTQLETSAYDIRSKTRRYIRIYNNGTETAKFSLGVRKRNLEGSISGDTENKIEIGGNTEQKWYKFVADEKNFYTLLVTNESDNQVTVWSYRAETGGNSVDNTPLQLNAKEKGRISLDVAERGEVRYLCVSSDTATKDKPAKITIKVMKRTEKAAIQEGKEGTVLTVEPDNERWYSFEATEDNVYSFTSDNVANGPVRVLLYKDILDRNNIDGYDLMTDDKTFDMSNIPLRKGDKRYFCLIPSDDAKQNATMTIHVGKRILEEKSLDLDENGKASITGISLEGGEEKWYQFTAAENNTYTFYSEDIAGGNVALDIFDSLYDLDEDAVNDDPFENEGAKLNAEIYLKNTRKPVYIRLTNIGTAKVEMSLNAKKRNIVKPGLDGAGVTVSLKAGEELWYTFTADETNCYQFYTDGNIQNGSATIGLYVDGRADSIDDAIDETTSDSAIVMDECPLAEGQKIYVRVKAENQPDAAKSVNLILKVSKRIVEKDNIVSGETGNDVTVKKGDSWYKFTAEEDNTYTFAAEDGKGVSTVLSLYEKLDSLEPLTAGNTIPLKKGESRYIKLETILDDGVESGKTKIVITKITPKKLKADAAGVKFDLSNEAWFEFTPEELGLYRFVVTNADSRNMTLAITDNLAEPAIEMGGNANITSAYRRLDTASKIYLRVALVNSNANTSSVTIKVEKAFLKAVTGQAERVGGTYAYQYEYTFTAEEFADKTKEYNIWADGYEFSSTSGSLYCSVYNEEGRRIAGGTNRNANLTTNSVRCNLESGQKVTVRIESRDDFSVKLFISDIRKPS